MVSHMDYTEYTKFFIALLSIVDPLAALPVYFAMTQGMPAARKQKLPSLLAVTITITLLVALFLGETILAFFGISTGSFRVASGLLLLLTAYQMFQNSSLYNVMSSNHDTNADAVVPLAIPLLAGPGAISTVIIYASHHHSFVHSLSLALCITLLGLVVWVFFRMASVLVQKISALALAISSKIMGLIIAAIAIEFIANGVKLLFAV
jgi:multiple antibiotic resistance protein